MCRRCFGPSYRLTEGPLLTLFAFTFWEALFKYLYFFGIVGGTLSVLPGLSLGLASAIDLINTRYDGDVKKYIKTGFKLKRKK